MSNKFILAIDQGTTSSRAILFDLRLNPVSIAQKEFPQYFPNSGWVEHNPNDLLKTTLEMCHKVIKQKGISAKDIATIGITNQRETTIVWNKNTGRAIYNAIVWQDRRSADYCKELKKLNLESSINKKTGLLLDPYFSATKIHWILNHVSGAKKLAKEGKLLFGTVDCFLLWHLTNKKTFATDATNASRTMLYNINKACWDSELLDIFDIPQSMLPKVYDCSYDFGYTESSFFDGISIPIQGIAGDQQAASIGQACFKPSMVKSTYGTGCFALINTGDTPVTSKARLLTTIAYQLNGKPTYALEGSIFVAGAVIQWLRDSLGIIKNSSDSEPIAQSSNIDEKIYFIPAFTGLGAPYWDSECRGAIFGLTRNTSNKEIVRAALESVAFQTKDLIEAMKGDWKSNNQTILRVDGGMANNDWAMQNLSNILLSPVDRPSVTETTAKGAAYLAGLKANLCPSPDEIMNEWELDRQFNPKLPEKEVNDLYKGWKLAVNRLLYQPA